MRVLPLLPLLLSGFFVVPAHADDAQDWLKRLGAAEQQQSYQGTFVYERNGSFSTHRIWHRVQDGKVRERLVQLDGAPYEVVRADGRTECVTGKLINGLADVADTTARQLDLQRLENWYAVTRAGDSRVAGRPVAVIVLTPRDQHRYGVELYLDRETGLPLKSLLVNDKGQLLERFQFTHLETTPPNDSQLTPGDRCQAVATSQAAAPVSKPVHSWHSDWLPPGFELLSSNVRRDPKTKTEVTSLMYDDGLTRFSVFLEPLKGDAVPDMRLQLGPTVAVSRHLSTPDAEILATVVGEIPMGTAERIALSMRAGQAEPSTTVKP
ncbi:RNA polymerase subunit sigma [Pseudomonas sp. FSL R10-1350]|uniref:MucB/RseB C-terminal domain-containing protein n=1 Tax=Pseudomonas TaxID=286 RepID=UPI000653C2F1|nr:MULTISPECIES: MucB/RseB C-terminal domain-containing protein [Pseudomonas]KMN10311.1 RNA polymerase sigma-H factor AlgU [Pseudomonas helleri]MQU62618.1 RNA polymerase subunit sigma [Pseudomonas sp. FSL R10-1350]